MSSKTQSNKNNLKVLKNKLTNTGEKGGKSVKLKNPDLNIQNIPKPKLKKLKRLNTLKKQNDDLNEKLEKNNELIKQEKEQTINELKQINLELENKEIEYKKITNENKNLFNKLILIKEEVSNQIKSVRFKRIKDEDYEDKSEKIKLRINLHEEEIKNLIQLIPQLEREKHFFEKILERNNEETKYNLLNDLLIINDKNEKIEKEIKNMKEEIKLHQKCKKKLKQMEYEYNLLRNDLDFEKKKIILNQSLSQSVLNNNTISYYDEESNEIKVNSYKNKNILSEENKYIPKRENSFLNPIRRKFKLSLEAEERREKEELKVTLNPLWNEIRNENNNYKIFIKNKPIKSFFMERLKNNKVKSLFRDKEFDIISKLVPEHCLNNYSLKFDNLENEKKNIQNEYKDTIEIKRQIFKNNNLKISNSTKQMNKLNEDAKLINIELIKQKQEIKNLNEKIKIERKNIKDVKNIYNIKEKENEKLKNYIFEMQERIDKGELILKEEENNNEEEEGKNEEDENEEQKTLKENLLNNNDENNDEENENNNEEDNEHIEEEKENHEEENENHEEENVYDEEEKENIDNDSNA